MNVNGQKQQQKTLEIQKCWRLNRLTQLILTVDLKSKLEVKYKSLFAVAAVVDMHPISLRLCLIYISLLLCLRNHLLNLHNYIYRNSKQINSCGSRMTVPGLVWPVPVGQLSHFCCAPRGV